MLQEVFAASFNAMLRRRPPDQRAPLALPDRAQPLPEPPAPARPAGQDSMDVFERDGGSTTADTVHKREEFRQIVADVQDLPETQRTALLLREIDALSYDQIAEAMDTTVPSVKSLLVRARVSLAEAAEARLLTCDEVRLELGEVAEGLARTPPRPPPPEDLRALPHLPRPSCARPPRRWPPCTRSARSSSSRSCAIAQARLWRSRAARRPRHPRPAAAPPPQAWPGAAAGGRPAPRAASPPAGAVSAGCPRSPRRPRPEWPPPRSSPPARWRSRTCATRPPRRRHRSPRPSPPRPRRHTRAHGGAAAKAAEARPEKKLTARRPRRSPPPRRCPRIRGRDPRRPGTPPHRPPRRSSRADPGDPPTRRRGAHRRPRHGARTRRPIRRFAAARGHGTTPTDPAPAGLGRPGPPPPAAPPPRSCRSARRPAIRARRTAAARVADPAPLP